MDNSIRNEESEVAQTSKGWSSWVWSVLSVTALAAVLAWLLLAEEPAAELAEEPAESFQAVTVVSAQPQDKELILKATGLTKPRWQAVVSAAVSGRAQPFASPLEPGMLLKQGETLVQIEPSRYQAAMQRANSELANAELKLARVRYEQQVAKRTGGKLRTAFARHEPQVSAAEAERRAARTNLNEARQRLQDSTIAVPFDAIVLSRTVTPGQWLNEGDNLLQIAASDSLDIEVFLTDKQWQQLQQPDQLADLETGLQVIAPDGQRWPARVRYLNPVRDSQSRQRSLVLAVDQPYQAAKPLLIDQQVSVELPGKVQLNVFMLPASVLTDDGQLWTLDDKDQLQLETVVLVEQQDQHVWLTFTEQPEQQRRVVRYPLNSMLVGQQVTVNEHVGQTVAQHQSSVSKVMP